MLIFVWAESKNHVIGYHNKLPWHLPADMHHFKEVTTNNIILAGRKTYDSFGGRPLPHRKNLVISKNNNLNVPENVGLFNNINDFLKYADKHQNEKICIIGGAAIFKLFSPYVDELCKTLIDADFKGDTFMPKINYSKFKLIDRKIGHQDDKNIYPYRFDLFKRIKE